MPQWQKKKKKRPQVHLEKNKVSSCSRSCPNHRPVTGDSVFLQSSGEMRLCCFCAVYIPLMCLTVSLSLTVHPATLPRCLPLMFSHLNAEAAGFVYARFYGSYLFSADYARERERETAPNSFFSKSENIVEIIWVIFEWNDHDTPEWPLTFVLMCMSW